ncbi:DMT family transporter [Maritalea mediterranea]|uniref:DMT family transporter n=1 Tax=Maritalea mediterranea TaxID=2909667 RepID=A0ABS9EB74_9HYPH|nr:DMT family transporter [Maritalea mediterranea]MCF4100018.1 DMT family transporter [Maritalea mediterranea]
MTSSAAPNRLLGYFIGALGASFFSTKGIVIKLALLENVDAVTTLTWRMIIAVPFFAVIGYFGYRKQKANNGGQPVLSGSMLAKACAVGVMGYYVASYLDFAGLNYISAQFDRLILLTYPIFVVVLGALWHRRKISMAAMIALGLSYGGLAIIFAHDLQLEGEDTVIGALLVLGAALAFAIYQLLAKPLIDQIGARLFTSIAMSAAGGMVILHFLATHEFNDLILSERAMWLMLAIGTISTVAPAYLISISIGMVGPEPTAVLGNVSTIVTIILAITILGEPFSIYHGVGAALVLCGVLLFTHLDHRARKLPAGAAQLKKQP